MTDDALDTLYEIAMGGEKDADRIKAAQDLLNRAGMKQAQEINVRHESTSSPGDELMDRLNNLATHQNDQIASEIIEAEVITDDN